MPNLVAHRGLHDRHPENSLAAFQAAWEAGVPWCECDIQMSSDGVAVVLHDRKLRRTTGGRGKVERLPASWLTQIQLRGADRRITDHRIPTLQSVCRAIPRDCGLWVEIKPALRDADRFLAQIENADRVKIHSFHPDNLRLLEGRGFEMALLVGKRRHLRRSLEGPWQAVHIERRLLSRKFVEKCREAGKAIGVWTVNKKRHFRKCRKLGVDTIITDAPHKWRPH